MFTDEDEDLDEKKKKRNKKKNNKEEKVSSIFVRFQSLSFSSFQKDSKKSFSGFLIDNVTNEDEDGDSSKSQKRTASKSSNGSSVTTVESGSYKDEDDESANGYNSDAKSDDNNNEQVEIVKSYRTRSRTAAKIKEKQDSLKNPNGNNFNSNIFDSENNNVQSNENIDDEPIDNSDQPWLDDMREKYWFPFLDMLPDESEFDIYLSGKLVLLKSILDKCADIGDKILLFSRSLYTLNYIERFLHFLQTQNEEEYRKQCESRRQLRQMLISTGKQPNNGFDDYIPKPVEWIRDQDYFRMDGQTDVSVRKRYAIAFNDENNLRARLFLISTLAGGIGINLIGSNRVIVFDASWNPR